VSLLQHPSHQFVLEAALVLDAIGIDQRTHHMMDQWNLLVRPDDAPEAGRQLATYLAENRAKPIRPLHVIGKGRGWVGVAGFLGVIWMLPWVEGQFGLQHLRDAGALHAAAVRDGAWWQVITALTLHADLGHIAGNSLFGGMFGYLLARSLGAGVGWFLAVLCAGVANLTSAFVQADDFRALGASTAVFAALGLMGAYAWQRGYFDSDNRRRRFAPAFAAIAMIAFTGTSGENTDLFGHLFGFAYGFAAGFFYARWNPRHTGMFGQWLAGTVTIMLITTAWWAAI
jgi:rhomboid protease GluP